MHVPAHRKRPRVSVQWLFMALLKASCDSILHSVPSFESVWYCSCRTALASR
uniref:Secreted protein n=1 Tax=Anopheles atroparvus TaxID=41427 RepID=A0AAG5CZW4_ANOAO